MVAGSRSSLRRPTLRGHNSPTSSSPLIENTPPLLPQSGNGTNVTRIKRLRTSTITGDQQTLKRRRLSTSKNEIPQLRIPLRSRGGLPKVISAPPTAITQNAAAPKLQAHSPNIGKPLDSPSGKPQYDQIKIIEERARASIRGGGPLESREERRKLRSEDGGSRAKTELAQYFPEFEEMLNLKPSEPGTLTVRTKIILVDDTPDFKPRPPRTDPFGVEKALHNVQIIPISQRGVSTDATAEDPLNEDVYLKIHAKAERHEKQIKNGDRERAQHEKYQLEKLLEDLRGPDWLKTLGISGITETEKKRYEPKRLLFIRETQGLIDKFKRWKEEEKRRKLEREQALLEEAVEEVESMEAETSEEDEGSIASESTQAANSSEIDALASQQLIDETTNASKRRKAMPSPLPLPEPPPPKPFVSFFDKRHLRDAAVSGRQRGRNILAFGEAVPEFEEKEFQLPNDVLTEDAIKASQRSRRRVRRGVED
ncbi:hypothetical protein LTS15_000797 [Exophiala xenobiotica]|nr:hypothetical protein LTS15_000797 [Exophiala xenobiotica]